MTSQLGTVAFRAARDQLLALSGDPDRAAAEFRWPDVGPAFNWARDWFDVLAEGNEDVALRIAEEDGSEAEYRFDELRLRSNRLGAWLREIGIGRGDVVMLMLDNRVELWEAMLAIMKIGAVILPTSVVLGPDELADRVERAGARAVLAVAEDAQKFAAVPGDYLRVLVGDPGAEALPGWLPLGDAATASDAPLDAGNATEDLALIYFTSGTTNLPKIVGHTHRSYPVGHLSTMYWLGIRPGDTHLVISSPGWGKHAWSSFFAPWHVGATIFVVNYARFDAQALVGHLDRAGVHTFCAPPTVWRLLIQDRLERKPRNLREVVSAGEPLNPEVIARIKEWWGLEIRDGYGQTETTAIIANSPGMPVRPGAMGKPLPGVRVALVDPMTGERAEPGAEGEVCLELDEEPLNLMAGYLGSAEATERARSGGFFHTGDVAQADEDGYLTFIGRTDDIFKSSDYKVSPFEVESALIEHPAVTEAAVIGAPCDTRLNVTKAYVSLAPGWEPTEATALIVLRHARVTLPPYMRVRRVEFFELPKTSSGKIRRVELREREVAAHQAGERLWGEWREEDYPGLKD